MPRHASVSGWRHLYGLSCRGLQILQCGDGAEAGQGHCRVSSGDHYTQTLSPGAGPGPL